MKTENVKWHMENGGIGEKLQFRTHASMSHGRSIGLHSNTIVESFMLLAPDGSEFLITITQLKEERNT